MKSTRQKNVIYECICHAAMTVALLWLTVCPAKATTRPTAASIDSLLHCIDTAIEHSEQYVHKKMDRIDYLKSEIEQAETLSAKYELTYQIYVEYLPFINDSAIVYLERCSEIAQQMGDDSKKGSCLSLIALSCSNAGMYIESEAILKDINPSSLHDIDLGLYYYAYGHLSGELAYYGKFKDMRKKYTESSMENFMLAQQNLPHSHKYYNQCREMMAQNQGDFKQSLAINNEWIKQAKAGSTEYALVSFYRYLDYKALGDSIQAMYWLGESVLSDIRNAVMDQGSLWEMANLLMTKGDIDRSYRYICFTSDCADRFGSRQRLSRISPLLSHIAKQYKTNEEKSNRSLCYTIAVISLLSVLLLAALVYVYRKRNQLAMTRDQLAKSNEQLKDTNTQLSSLNSQLALLNLQLSEANRVKDEYVGRFLRLCSVYIDKLEDIRKKVIKRVKNKQFNELAEFTRSADFTGKETDELYENFDNAFLQLFPSFVYEFNALLKPENRVMPPDNKSLNTIIRIFALIRLGITDSSKIAEFLHYSVNTIYNYRANIKNGALCDRTEFEDRVRQIGMPNAKNT